MIKTEFFIFIILLLSFRISFSQDFPEDAIIIDENTVIKDESGNKVEIFTLMELMNSGEWTMDPVNNAKGELLYMQLRKATEAEKKLMSQMPLPGNESSLIGQEIHDFNIHSMEGKLLSKKNLDGKVVLLNFWFTTCKPCIAEIPELNEVYEKFKSDTNVVFGSITFEKRQKVKAFLKKHPIQLPMYTDAQKVCNVFDVVAYPTNIIIDKKGRYFDIIGGGFPKIGDQISNSILNALDELEPASKAFPSGGEIIDPNSTFVMENGEKVSFDKVIELINSNQYFIIPKIENGKEYYLIKEK